MAAPLAGPAGLAFHGGAARNGEDHEGPEKDFVRTDMLPSEATADLMIRLEGLLLRYWAAGLTTISGILRLMPT